MALPVFRAASAKSNAAQTTTPALPAGIQADDIILLVAVCPVANTISITANGSAGTWTAITGTPVAATAGSKLYVWWARYGGSGSTGPTVQASASDVIHAATLAYSGCLASGSPINNQAVSTENTSDTSFSFATGISSSVNDCLAICVASILRDSNTGSVPVMTNASLASLNVRYNECTNTGVGGGFGVTEGAKATAGTLGTFACTYAASSAKAYAAFALAPAVTIQSAAAAETFTFTETAAALRDRMGASAQAYTLTDAAAAEQVREAAAAEALSFGETAAALRDRLGAAAEALVFGETAAGEVEGEGGEVWHRTAGFFMR